MDRGAWWATVHGVAKVRHDLVTKQQYFHFCTASDTLLCSHLLRSLNKEAFGRDGEARARKAG